MHLGYCKRRRGYEAIQGGGVGAEGPETLVATRDGPVEGPPFRSRERSDHNSSPCISTFCAHGSSLELNQHFTSQHPLAVVTVCDL
jgi:hypothetical protein